MSREITSTATREVVGREYKMLAEFRYALRQFLRFSEEAAHTIGLTPQQHQALLAIMGTNGGSGLTLTELAEQLQLKHHSVVGLVNRLELAGHVSRSAGVDDRRKVVVTPTASGEKLIKALSSAHREELKRIAPQFRSLLRRLT